MLPRSHLRHAELTADQPPAAHGGVDYCAVPADDPRLAGLGAARLLCARAGDLLLWDSRTVHASEPPSAAAPLPRADDGTPRPSRAACYICHVPAAPHLARDATLGRRRAHSLEHWLTCTHWPADNRMASQGRQPPDPGRLDRLPAEARALVLRLARDPLYQA